MTLLMIVSRGNRRRVLEVLLRQAVAHRGGDSSGGFDVLAFRQPVAHRGGDSSGGLTC